MSSVVDYFEQVIDFIEKGEIVPYYIEACLPEMSHMTTSIEKGQIIKLILCSSESSDIFRYLHKNQSLKVIFPELVDLSVVPQKKGRARNAFEHTMNVIDCIPESEFEYLDMKIVAVMHDLGKFRSFYEDNHFQCHADYSVEIAKNLFLLWGFRDCDHIVNIIRCHMWPLDYQRNPNWTDKAVDNFIKRCGSNAFLIDNIISFSIYDKKAENGKPEFLQILYDFRKRVISLMENGNGK